MNDINEFENPQPIKDLLDIINSTDKRAKNILTKEKVEANLDIYTLALKTFLMKPDILIDIMTPKDSKFALFFFQRIILRSMARYKYSFITATRAASKSFSAFISRYIAAMLLPGHKTFVCANVKKQATAIAQEKILDDIWVKFPLLKNEMKKFRENGQIKNAWSATKEDAKFTFTHKGRFDVVGTGSSTRGGRRHSGILEEMITQDPVELAEIVIPLMNVDRQTMLNELVESEPHGAQLMITSAGFKGSFAYEKLLYILCMSVVDPDNYIALGFSYRTPMNAGLINPQKIIDAKIDNSKGQGSFDREYDSKWTGTDGSLSFSSDILNKNRFLPVPDFKYKVSAMHPDAFYVLSADMSKDGDANTVAIMFKVIPEKSGFSYRVVNLFQFDDSNYERLASQLKDLIHKYNVKLFAYDANGIGASLRDWLTRSDENGPAYGIINPPKDFKPTHTSKFENKICFEIKASTTGINNKIYKLTYGEIYGGRISFLTDHKTALGRYEKQQGFKNMSHKKRMRILQPHVLTDTLIKEFQNLKTETIKGGQDFKVTRESSKIQKDTYSALSYGIYAIKNQLEPNYYASIGNVDFEDMLIYLK